MIVVTYVSYRFNINVEYTRIMKAMRGIRQGDPISPLLLFINMEYMNMSLYKMHKNPDFNHHVKCEKLQNSDLIQEGPLPFIYLGVPLTSKKTAYSSLHDSG